jgi:hypothetical protein|tara:strand:+ start:409 stop:549 length:141 start_codon:yes stop_codon:yes gene_type:complete
MLEVDMVVSLDQHQMYRKMVLQELPVLVVAVVQVELTLMVATVVLV